MLIRFYIKNFRSFNEKVEFNMLAGAYKRHEGHVHQHNNLKILKYSAIYGPNAVGKSNFLWALYALQQLVTEGTTTKDSLIAYTPFRLDKSIIGLPTEFEIDFLHQNKVYSYSIKYTETLILEEWLYILGEDKNELVFQRSTNPNTLNSELTFNESFFSVVEEKIAIGIYQKELRHNQPFLFEGYNKDLKDIKDAYFWLKRVLVILMPNEGVKGLVYGYKNDLHFRDKFNEIMQSIGPDIDKFDVKEVPFDDFFGKSQESFRKSIEPNLRKDIAVEWGVDKGTIYGAYFDQQNNPVVGELKIYHKDSSKEYVEFPLADESRGTLRLLSLLPALIHISEKNSVIFIDELESSIHPKLLESLLRLIFESNTITKGQLVFTTHQTDLLDLNLLRQDEIWFTNKNNNKSTEMYSLSDFKVRFDLDIRNGYLKGMFGSIPCVRDFDNN
jgi:uncharacterized protein